MIWEADQSLSFHFYIWIWCKCHHVNLSPQPTAMIRRPKKTLFRNQRLEYRSKLKTRVRKVNTKKSIVHSSIMLEKERKPLKTERRSHTKGSNAFWVPFVRKRSGDDVERLFHKHSDEKESYYYIMAQSAREARTLAAFASMQMPREKRMEDLKMDRMLLQKLSRLDSSPIDMS